MSRNFTTNFNLNWIQSFGFQVYRQTDRQTTCVSVRVTTSSKSQDITDANCGYATYQNNKFFLYFILLFFHWSDRAAGTISQSLTLMVVAPLCLHGKNKRQK